MKSGNFFETWYKKKIEEGNQIPPDDIWKNVSEELDIHSVWRNISTELDHRKNKKRRRVGMIYVFSLAGLIFISTWLYRLEPALANKTPIKTNVIAISNKTIKTNEHPKQVKKSNNVISSNTLVSITVPITTMAVSVNRMTSSITKKTTPFVRKTLPNITVNEQAENKTNQSSLVEKENITLNESNTEINYIQPINYTGTFLQANDTNLIVRHLFLFDSIEKPPVGRFYAGVAFSIQNPWLLNHSTFNSFFKNSINEAVPGVGICYGVSAAYYFNKGWNINADLFMAAKYGQTYNAYNKGNYETEKINLNYKQINLYGVKRTDRQQKNKNLLPSFGPLFGINIKTLNYANKSINGFEKDVTEQYTKYDFGLLIGYEYSLSLRRDWLFSTSINGDVGLNNIYAGKGLESRAFNQTNNASIRWVFSVRYLIK